MRYCLLLLVLALILSASQALAQNQKLNDIQDITLEAAELTVEKETIDRITQTDIERKTALTLWEALKSEPGVSLNYSGGRNEGAISIRGSNRYQVGLYVDDIPLATAYRNEWDANNLITFDMESIEVSKGYTSPLLANNNNLAGIVNVRTAKPTKELEFKAKYMNFFDRNGDDQGRLFGVSVGTKQDLFYLKTSVVQDEQDFYTLSSDFPKGKYQDSGHRGNSDYKNRYLNLVTGFVPSDTTDLMFGLVRQYMRKGQPYRAGANPPSFGASGAATRLFKWPEYDTERYYMNANFTPTSEVNLKILAYYDKHTDDSVNYTDCTFSVIDANHGDMFGLYDQFTAGLQSKFDYTFNEANKLAASVSYRELSHKGYTSKYSINVQPNLLINAMKENYWDLGAEYTFKLIDPLTLVAGLNYTMLKPKSIKSYTVNNVNPSGLKKNTTGANDNLLTYQLGAFFNLTEGHQLFATFAHKARFATMRERFDSPANTGLSPEEAMNYEIGYRGVMNEWLRINTSLFYVDTKDMITGTGQRSPDISFFNMDEIKIYGFELATEAAFNEYFSAGTTLSFLQWANTVRDPLASNLTFTPKTQGSIYAKISPLKNLSIIPQVDYVGPFYNDANDTLRNLDGKTSRKALGTNKTSGFITADSKVVYDFNEYFSFEVGAKNIFDKNIYYDYDDFPRAGRNYFVGLTGTY